MIKSETERWWKEIVSKKTWWPIKKKIFNTEVGTTKITSDSRHHKTDVVSKKCNELHHHKTIMLISRLESVQNNI